MKSQAPARFVLACDQILIAIQKVDRGAEFFALWGVRTFINDRGPLDIAPLKHNQTRGRSLLVLKNELFVGVVKTQAPYHHLRLWLTIPGGLDGNVKIAIVQFLNHDTLNNAVDSRRRTAI